MKTYTYATKDSWGELQAENDAEAKPLALAEGALALFDESDFMTSRVIFDNRESDPKDNRKSGK